jgi:hypothetical protein
VIDVVFDGKSEFWLIDLAATCARVTDCPVKLGKAIVDAATKPKSKPTRFKLIHYLRMERGENG